MDSHEKVLKMFFPFKKLNSIFSKERDVLELFFLSLFFLCLFFSIFSILRLFIKDELKDF
jgi:hypothetical protein